MMENQQHGEKKNVFLVIHGHFYQPPRENPWTQTIPLQESAKPFHDWNERITAQCYQPNTRSRFLDEQGRILQLVNNFAHINFNIGPTLFSWIKKYHPDIYRRILEAEQKSQESNQGHGNAIAQIYNHIILPLANDRDKITQIIWGKREFRDRFGRDPESIWLAETAINMETVKCLIDQEIRYVILSPTQAQRIRKFGESNWTDVSHNTIDITQPYRIFLRDKTQETRNEEEETNSKKNDSKKKGDSLELAPKYLDVFFYDGPLSTEISFKHLLRDANTFAHRLYELAAKSPSPNVLIHVATDGEVYGHHEPYGDMCLAAAITSKFPSLDVEITNYARYLEMFPPTMEVELKPGGDNDEGTAWSCAHGVGRWYRNCGCSISHNPGWNQEWRTPLRKGFDILRDILAELFEQIGGELLQDPWKARNDYIECILDPSEHTVNTFLKNHAKYPLNEDEQSWVLRLLEAQKYSMYTYTSCAWFFDDVSGLEVQQNMRYAARAVHLVEGIETRNSKLETRNSDAQ
jgi:alpha-amylase/alpha-mannosidase (GH57 family)